MSFADYLSDGFDRLDEPLPLAAIPLLVTFLDVDNIRTAVGFHGWHFGFAFRFPTAIPTLQTFVSVPNTTSGIHVSPTLYLMPIVVVVESVLAAGYVGSVRDAIETGRYDFDRNTRTYFLPFLGYTILVRVVQLLTFGLGLLFVPLLFVGFVGFLILSYLFYGVPFLLVVDDRSLDDALRRSYELAVGDQNYSRYGLGYLVFVFVSSLVGTLVVNFGIVGIVFGAVVVAPVALALTVATVHFFLDLGSSDPEPVVAESFEF